MKNIIILWGIAMIVVLALPSLVRASIPDVYTNENFWSESTTHDKPVSFDFDAEGNIYGLTETGKSFSQVTIANESGVRLQKFMIDDAFYYIYVGGIIQADTNEEAIALALLG